MRKRRARGTARVGGFTLLEMLLAVAVSGAVVAAVYGTLSAAVRARDTARAAVGQDRALRSAIDTVRRDLQAAPRPGGVLAGTFLGSDNADADEVSFTTTNPYRSTPDRLADMINVRLQRADDDGQGLEGDEVRGRMLVREVTTNLLAASTPEPMREVLLRGVRSFDARYVADGAWVDDYDSTQYGNVLPRAAELVIVMEPEAVADGRDPGEPVTRRALITLPAGRDDDSLFGLDFGSER